MVPTQQDQIVKRDKLQRLIDQVLRIVDGDQAFPWGDLWERTSSTAGSLSIFSYPTPIAGTGQAPFIFCPDPTFYARLFGYKMREIFTDTITYLCFSLEQMIWNHEHLHHDGIVSTTIQINQEGFFAPSLFGLMPTYADDAVPWIKGSIITGKDDLYKIKPPDFYTSGLSPLVHRMYTEARDLLPEELDVEFITWLTGPFPLNFHLRGPTNLAMDIIDDPPFVHEMMSRATECMKSWWSERALFLDRPGLDPLILGNDEVGVPMISPRQYETFVLPYEIELSETFGGIDYWHSCANLTPLLPLIARIPNLRMMDVGPWTALEPAVKLFGERQGSCIMKRLHPVSEILMATEEQMRARLLQIKAICYEIPYMLFFDGINVMDDLSKCVDQVLLLDRVCHDIFHNDPTYPVIDR